MGKFDELPKQPAVDLTEYLEKILSPEDAPLFIDAVEAAKVGALRAAYVMIWLSCAESLKRRFREAQQRDKKASRVISKIKDKEKKHNSVDQYVLDSARDYGFISDSTHNTLSHIYTRRCVYAHPYEEAPSKEEMIHAAAAVVDKVLSQPVKLKHGFAQQLLEHLLKDQNYIDDQPVTIVLFASEILSRIDESIHGWLLEEYLKELEKIAADPSMNIFLRRGKWFCSALIKRSGCTIFSVEEWHAKISEYPKILIQLCQREVIFKNIGERAQDSLVGRILTEAESRPNHLKFLERLHRQEALSERHIDRFQTHVAQMSSADILSSGLSPVSCFDIIITELKSHDWYRQNPAVDIVKSRGPKKVSKLQTEQQIELGRNILQASDGGARYATNFLAALHSEGSQWPNDFLLGILLELFINENKTIRFKEERLEMVFNILDKLASKQRDNMLEQLKNEISLGKIHDWITRVELDDILTRLNRYPWTKTLVEEISNKTEKLPSEAIYEKLK